MAFNMRSEKDAPCPTQDPNVRNKNFEEVALGYTAEMAVDEAQALPPLQEQALRDRLPGRHRHPGVHRAMWPRAILRPLIRSSTATTSLPAVCGRVCPQESQCEGKCVRGIKGEPVGIGRLERFVADWHRENVAHRAQSCPRPTATRSPSSAQALPA